MANVDRKAFHAMTYGLFLLTSRVDGRDNGCIVNTAIQSGSEPRQVTVAVIKGSCTQEMIDAAGEFVVSVLGQSTPVEFFNHFGMQSGHDVEKFVASDSAEVPGAHVGRCENGLVYEPTAVAYLSCQVTERSDLGSHVLYTGTVTEAAKLSDETPITYDYYRTVTKKSGEQKVATGKVVAWKCAICGYIYEGETIPEDFVCPLCKHGTEDFVPVYETVAEPAAVSSVTMAAAIDTVKSVPTDESTDAPNQGGNKMAKWVCTVCGYIYEGEEPPAECPVCHVPASKFKKVEGELQLAAEHEFGIYGKTVANNDAISDEDKAYIKEQLMANFQGECSEVGMYLCMARVAHREGYPEIGLYWEKAAYEEAEHAAKFAELLGSELEPCMKADTKANLAWRVDCEFGATQGKVDLATCAKKNGLDAIHDTVHEMARDEARHGRALKGLLERYFG